MLQVMIKIFREDDSEFYFSFSESGFNFFVALQRFFNIKIFTCLNFVNDLLGDNIFGIIRDNNFCIFYFIGECKTEDYNLRYGHSEKYQQRFSVTKYVEEFFF